MEPLHHPSRSCVSPWTCLHSCTRSMVRKAAFAAIRQNTHSKHAVAAGLKAKRAPNGTNRVAECYSGRWAPRWPWPRKSPSPVTFGKVGHAGGQILTKPYFPAEHRTRRRHATLIASSLVVLCAAVVRVPRICCLRTRVGNEDRLPWGPGGGAIMQPGVLTQADPLGRLHFPTFCLILPVGPTYLIIWH